jgi:hypothetical protein
VRPPERRGYAVIALFELWLGAKLAQLPLISHKRALLGYLFQIGIVDQFHTLVKSRGMAQRIASEEPGQHAAYKQCEGAEQKISPHYINSCGRAGRR